MSPDEIYENMNTESDGSEENKNNDTENEEENNEQLKSSEDLEINVTENEEESEKVTTRGGRVVIPPSRYGFSNLQVRVKEYSNGEAWVLINIMQCMEKKFQFAQRYTLKKRTIKFGNRARQAARSELRQLNKRMVFTPIHREDITKEEIKKQWRA